MESPATALPITARRHGADLLPGLVFAFRFASDGSAVEIHPATFPDVAADPQTWYWLNFNLADNRACQLISQTRMLPETARTLMVGQHDHQQLYASADCVYGVFSDLIRDFDRANE